MDIQVANIIAEAAGSMMEAANRNLLAVSLLAEVESMKIENVCRKMRDESPAYYEDDFARLAANADERSRT